MTDARTILVGAVLAGALAGAGCRDHAAPSERVPPPPAETPPTPLDAEPGDRGWFRLERVAREAGLSIEVGMGETLGETSHRCMHNNEGGGLSACYACELAHPADLAVEQAEGLADAIRATPPEILKLSTLRRLVMCRTLPNASRHDRAASATLDRAAGDMLVAVDSRRDLQSARELFHHELYHLIDLENGRESAIADVEWNALNPDRFRGYSEDRADHVVWAKGFASMYAQTNAVEDKAETYAWAVSHGTTLCLDHANDAALLAKIRMIETRLARRVGDAPARFVTSHAPCSVAPAAEPAEKPSR